MLNAAHLHLVINHIPVILFPAGLLLLVYALITEDDKIMRVSLGVFFLVALATVPVYVSGLHADRLLDGVPGVCDPAIDIHRAAALKSMLVAELLGLFSIVVLMAYRNAVTLPKWSQGIALALAFIVAGLMTFTSYLGGHIRHPETFPNWKPPHHESRIIMPTNIQPYV
jgi:hypothetical protein